MGLSGVQCERQAAFLLSLAKWPVAPNDPILTGGCAMSEDLEGNYLLGTFLPDGPPELVPPYARVRWVRGKRDSVAPGRLVESRLEVLVTAGAGGAINDPGDTEETETHGTDALIGSAYGAHGQGGSVGRGLDELIDALIQQTFASGNSDGAITATDFGFQGYVDELDQVDAIDGVEVVTRGFAIVVTDAVANPYYAPVRQFTTAGSGAGTIVLAWATPTVRFDTLPGNVPIVRYAAGAVPPATPTSGTGVPGVTSTGVTFHPGAGTWSVSVFVPFDASMPGPPAAATNYSNPVSASLTV